MANQSRIGFLGMGIMGTPMAMNLVRSGHNVAVWNRTTEKTKPVVALGATVYTQKKDLFSNCDIVFDERILNIKFTFFIYPMRRKGEQKKTC